MYGKSNIFFIQANQVIFAIYYFVIIRLVCYKNEKYHKLLNVDGQ